MIPRKLHLFLFFLFLANISRPLAAIDEGVKKRALIGGGVCVTSLILAKYYKGKVRGMEETLDDEPKTKRIERDEIEKYRLCRYLSLWVAVMSGLYSLKQVGGMVREALRDPALIARLREIAEEERRARVGRHTSETIQTSERKKRIVIKTMSGNVRINGVDVT